MTKAICVADGCGRPAYVRGLCTRHYRQDLLIHPRSHLTDMQRFMLYVAVAGPSDCWPWTGGTDRRGYGSFSIKRGGRWGKITASRWGYQQLVGPTGDQGVLHRCDNPPCCNPAHWFLGDQGVNMSDCADKGRSARGERNSSAILTEEDVLLIRARWADGETQTALAVEFGVCRPNISAVVHRKSWRYL
jgi:hypothetical protein